MLDKEFKEVPKYPWLQISKDGEVINSLTNERTYGSCEEVVENTKYLSAFSLHIHKLVALTWLDRPSGDIDDYVVNHKDGIKKNNKVDNLEWVSCSENVIHAYKNGMRNDNIIILSKDLRSEEILEFYSISECARYFKKSPALIHLYLKNINIIRLGYYVFKKKGQPWPNLTKEDISCDYKNKPRMLIATSTISNKQIISCSVSEMEKLLGVREGTLRMHLRRYPEKPYKDFFFKEVEDYELRDQLLKQRWEKIKKPTCVRKPLPVEIVEIETGKVKRYDSLQDFCNEKGVLKNTVQKSMLVKKGIWKNFKITYSPIHK